MLSIPSDAPFVPLCRLRLSHLIFCIVIVWGLHTALHACSVPVFRYGLEHWTADPYRVLIVHRGPLTESSQKLAASIRQASARANLILSLIDLAQHQEPESLAALKSVTL